MKKHQYEDDFDDFIESRRNKKIKMMKNQMKTKNFDPFKLLEEEMEDYTFEDFWSHENDPI